jgi:hypothetical protein
MAAAEDSFPYVSHGVVSPGYTTTFLLTVLLYDDYDYACWVKKNVKDVGVAYFVWSLRTKYGWYNGGKALKNLKQPA